MTIDSTIAPACAESSGPEIHTPRIALIAITPEMLRADFAKSLEFPRLIDAEIPAEWPSDGWDEDAYDFLIDKMEKYPAAHGWSRYIAVKSPDGSRRTLAGGCGLLGPIELSDDPEIGYGLLAKFQGQGYAVEAVAALLSWIFEHPHIRSVKAQTFPSHDASLRVLAKLNFLPAGPGPEEGAILFRRFREQGEPRPPEGIAPQ